MNKFFFVLIFALVSQYSFAQVEKSAGIEMGIYYPKFYQNIRKTENITSKYYLSYEANFNFKIVDTSKKIINTFLIGISTYNFHFKEYSSNAPSLTYYTFNDDSVLSPINITYTNIQKDEEGYITYRGEEKIKYINTNFLIGKTFSVFKKVEINISGGGMIGYRYYARFRRIDTGSNMQELFINENYPIDKANIIFSLPLFTSICFNLSKVNVGIYTKTMLPIIGESSLKDNYSNSGPSAQLKPSPHKPIHNLYNYYAWGIGFSFFYSIIK